MMFLLSKQKDTALLLEADNKAELIQQLRLHPEAVVILDYTLFDFTGADELIVLHERFKTADWLLFSDELSVGFLRQVLFSSMAFGVVLKDNSKEEILTALQCASRKERFICNHVSNLLLSGNNQSAAPHPTLQNALLTPAERSIPYREQPPEEHLQKTECEQCPRSYEICYESGHCGFGGVLYLISPLPIQSLAASSYTTPNWPGAMPCNFSSETIR